MRMHLKTRGRLIAIICPLLLAACSVVAIAAYMNAASALTDNAGYSLTMIAEQSAAIVKGQIRMQKVAIEGIADRSEIRSMDWAQQKPVLEAETTRMSYMGMGVVTPDRIAHYPDGDTVDLHDREYIEKAFAGQSTLSDVIISRKINEPVIMAAAPIRDADNKVAGVLIARLPGTLLSDVTSKIRYGEGGYSWIIDGKGAMIAHDNRQFVLDQRNFIEESAREPKLQALAAMMSRMTRGETGFDQYFFSGSDRFFGYAPIQGTTWSLAAGAERSSVLARQRELLWQVSGITAGIVALGVSIIWFMAAGITRPIARMVDRFKDIAEGEGDLTQRVDDSRQDELGELGLWFNRFLGQIHDTIAEVSQSSNEVASAATEIAASCEEMAASITEQSEQVRQMSTAIDDVSESITNVASRSEEGVRQAADAGRVAQEGGEVVTQTIDDMNRISDAVASSAAAITELGERSKQIGEIVKVINDIADQTNLLALNAAIEAARAGEHGRGFAVVADEVRKLADRTTRATEEIAESIKAIQSETDRAVNRMHTGTEQVSRGAEQAGKAGTSLNRIVASADAVREVIQTIAGAMQQQAASSEELSRNIATISSAGEQATQGTHQAAEAASHLSEKAEQLRRLVGRFRIANAR